jgi:hypothetical protein
MLGFTHIYIYIYPQLSPNLLVGVAEVAIVKMLGVSHFFPLRLVYANRRSMLVPPTHWAPHGIPSKAADQSPGSFFVGANFGPKCIWLQRARAPCFQWLQVHCFFSKAWQKRSWRRGPRLGGGAGAELTYLFGVWKLCTVCFGVAADAHMPKPTRIQMVVATWRATCAATCPATCAAACAAACAATGRP